MRRALMALILFASLVSSANHFSNQKKIRLYALVTPSHEILLNEWFLPSIKDDYEIIIERHEQLSPGGISAREEFHRTVIKKTKIIIQAIKANWGEAFIFSDVDIQFFKPTQQILLSLIKNNDLIIQKGSPGVACTGFFMLQANSKNLELWKKVRKYMQSHVIDDQTALNKYIVEQNPLNVVWSYLPDSFYSAGTIVCNFWTPGKNLVFPEEELFLHHATCTRGIPNKMAQLEYVKKHVLKNNYSNNFQSPDSTSELE